MSAPIETDLQRANRLEQRVAELERAHARLRGYLITASNAHALATDAVAKSDPSQRDHALAVIASAVNQARELLGAPERGAVLRAVDVAADPA